MSDRLRKRMRSKVLSVGTHFASRISSDNVHGSEVSSASHLDIAWSPDELNTMDSSRRNGPCTSGLGAVSYDVSFMSSYFSLHRRRPETLENEGETGQSANLQQTWGCSEVQTNTHEIVDGIEIGILALGVRNGALATFVGSGLSVFGFVGKT